MARKLQAFAVVWRAFTMSWVLTLVFEDRVEGLYLKYKLVKY